MATVHGCLFGAVMVKSVINAEPVRAKSAPAAVLFVVPDVWSHFNVTGCFADMVLIRALSSVAVACIESTDTDQERVTLMFCAQLLGVSLVDISSAFPV